LIYRFINSYLNIAFSPNVTMRTAYINGWVTYVAYRSLCCSLVRLRLPHILIVCRTDIEPGEELLLDYGAAYTEAFLRHRPHDSGSSRAFIQSAAREALPGLEDDRDQEDESSSH
jgi:hypothetical protein